MMARAGRWIPAGRAGLRHPAVAWTYTLPVWILLSLAIDLAGSRGRLSLDAAAARRRSSWR